jgi:hypothetical protein
MKLNICRVQGWVGNSWKGSVADEHCGSKNPEPSYCHRRCSFLCCWKFNDARVSLGRWILGRELAKHLGPISSNVGRLVEKARILTADFSLPINRPDLCSHCNEPFALLQTVS